MKQLDIDKLVAKLLEIKSRDEFCKSLLKQLFQLTEVEKNQLLTSLDIALLPEPANSIAKKLGILAWFDERIINAMLKDKSESESIINSILSLPFIEDHPHQRFSFNSLRREAWRAKYYSDRQFVKDTYSSIITVLSENNTHPTYYTLPTDYLELAIAHCIVGNYQESSQSLAKFFSFKIDVKDSYIKYFNKFAREWKWVNFNQTIEFKLLLKE